MGYSSPMSVSSRSSALVWLRPFIFPAYLALFMAFLHLVGLVDWIGASSSWGNIPRSFAQPWGVILFHFRHADWAHWLSNAGPLVLLSGLAWALFPKATMRAWFLMPIASGILLWCIGREGAHIGASALTYGWFHFLVGMGLFRRDRAAIAGMLVALFLFGSMVWIFIAPSGVSWEGHVSGAIAGWLCAWRWRLADPKPKPILLDDDEIDPPDQPSEGISLYATRPDSWPR